MNLLESPLTPHGKLWKTFYLFRNHLGHHIASSFPPTPTVFGQVPRNSCVIWELRPALLLFISSCPLEMVLTDFRNIPIHPVTLVIYSKIYHLCSTSFQSTLQYKVGSKRYHFHYGVKIDIKYISWISSRIYWGKWFMSSTTPFPFSPLQPCL